MAEFTRSPTSAVLTDSRGYVIDGNNPIPVNPAEAGAANHAEDQVDIDDSATPIVGVRATRRGVVIKNTHATTATYLGSASVSTSDGHLLAAGDAITIPTTAAIYGIAETASSVSFMEVYD